jgi:hypothetical protein
MSYHSSILERKQMLIKYSNVYQTKDKDRIGVNKYGLYPVLYGSYATFAEADKAKKEIQNGQSRSLALIESL